MSDAHTPGPWRVYPVGTRVPGYQVHAGIVSDCYSGQSMSDGPRHADLSLMAAAPDLLAGSIAAAGALQGAAKMMRDLGHAQKAATLEESLKPLMATINKANGGAA